MISFLHFNLKIHLIPATNFHLIHFFSIFQQIILLSDNEYHYHEFHI